MTPAAEAIARLDRGLDAGRGAYLTPEQVRALAGLIRGLVEAKTTTPAATGQYATTAA